MIEHCTRCGCKMTDLRIEINFNINALARKESDVWENIPNLNSTSKEILCMDCFDKFSSLMSQLNMEYKSE